MAGFLYRLKFFEQDLELTPESIQFLFRESIYGSSVFVIHATSYDWNKWDQLITTPEPYPLTLRMGLLDDLAMEHWSPWFHVMPLLVRYRYYPSGIRISFQGADAGYRLSEKVTSRAFNNILISDMVQRIADDNHLQAQITPTQGLHSFYQCHLSDAHFIRNILIPHAVSTEGRGEYKFYVRNGSVLVFGPPDLTQRAGNFSFPPSLTSASGANLQGLEVDYRRYLIVDDDGWSDEFRGFNPERRESFVLRGDNVTVTRAQLSNASAPPPVSPSRILLSIEPTREDALIDVTGSWSEKASQLYHSCIVLPPTIDYSVGMTATLTTQSPSNRPHFSSGDWLIYEIEQRWSVGSGTTVLHLERRDYFRG